MKLSKSTMVECEIEEIDRIVPLESYRQPLNQEHRFSGVLRD